MPDTPRFSKIHATPAPRDPVAPRPAALPRDSSDSRDPPQPRDAPDPRDGPALSRAAPAPPDASPGPRPLGRRALAGLGALLAAGCSPARILNDLAPDRLVASGIPYGDGPRRTLDVYAPALLADPSPVIVFLYGGGWKAGDKAMYRFVGAALAARGAIVVIPDYRLYPEVRYPDFLRDCAAATRWATLHARATAARLPPSDTPDPVFLVGHSAGAYNAAMLALDPRWLAAEGLSPRASLRGLVGLAGPYDFLPLDTAELVSIFGGQDRVDTQPITYARTPAPPALLCAGSTDTTVRPANTLHLAAALRAAGNVVEDRIYPGISHVEIIGAMAPALRFLAPTLRDTCAFVGLA